MEVLKQKHGICYAKANLSMALLRKMSIPTGSCHQKLRLFSEPDPRHCLHALSAVYIESLEKWMQLDACGNKPGINASFSLLLIKERIAFKPDPTLAEKDYDAIFTEPNKKMMRTLDQSSDALACI